jgi:hypothetical protein
MLRLTRAGVAAFLIVVFVLATAWYPVHIQAPRNAVLITLDGVRTEEIFGGFDRAVFASTIKEGVLEESPDYRRYWALTPEERREKVMPFFWGTLMRAHGSIAGNRARDSRFNITNRHRFSYPGYAEILTGAAHDDTINSNDNRRYAYPTVLEFLRARLSLPREKVGVFGSWETFNWIAEHEEGALTINAGYEAFETADPVARALSIAQFEAKTPWDGARHDAFTFALAMHYLQTERPRVLYIAFDETDDWAHDKRYDRVLDSLARTDAQLKTLWTWLQADPEYRDNTVLLITVDHGRGHTPDDWSSHGEKVDGAEDTWLAAIGPDWARRGEWTTAPPAYTNQVAATLAKALGQDFRAAAPDSGAPIAYLWER